MHWVEGRKTTIGGFFALVEEVLLLLSDLWEEIADDLAMLNLANVFWSG